VGVLRLPFQGFREEKRLAIDSWRGKLKTRNSALNSYGSGFHKKVPRLLGGLMGGEGVK